MNWKKFFIAFIAAFIFLFVFGFLWYGKFMDPKCFGEPRQILAVTSLGWCWVISWWLSS